MSKYTTEVRFILETAAGYDESQGAENIDKIIETAWSSVFYPPDSDKFRGTVIGNVAYHTYICQLILKHYYFREIGAETVGLWKTFMRTKLQEIAPYYNKMWESDKVLSATKALIDTDLKRTHSGSSEANGTDERTGILTGKDGNVRTLNTNQDSNNVRRYSDTPQGGLNGMESVEQNLYLTEAEIVDNNTKDTGTISDDGTTERKSIDNTTSTDTRSEEFTENVQGVSGRSYSELLRQYRDILINIDTMIINEFQDCFMNLW